MSCPPLLKKHHQAMITIANLVCISTVCYCDIQTLGCIWDGWGGEEGGGVEGNCGEGIFKDFLYPILLLSSREQVNQNVGWGRGGNGK